MLATLLGEAYGIHTPVCTPMTKGTVNRNYLVETPVGAYVLKHYAPVYRRDAAERSCSVQVTLRKAGLPVPEIHRNCRGELLTETPDGYFMLSEFVAGQQFERAKLPQGAARAMGETLGQMHRALAGMEQVPPYEFPSRDQVLARLRDLLARAEARRGDSAVDESACQILQEKIAALSAWQESPQPQPAQWVHGDYQETNVIFTEDDRVAAVIDFDNLRCLPRGLEVMRAFAFSFDAGNGPVEAAYDFFAGYVGTSGDTETEVARWSSDWAYYNLARDWPISSRYLEPETYDPRWDRFIVYRPGRRAQHHAVVTERFLDILKG